MTLATTLDLALPTVLGHAGAHLHPDASAFTSGLLHPLSGLDHLLAMCAIGLLAARLTTSRTTLGTSAAPLATSRTTLAASLATSYLAPALAALGLLVGFALGRAGLALGVELAIAGTVLALGLTLALRTTRPLTSAWTFAIPVVTLVHGQAHGLEAPPDATLFALGMTLTSVALVVATRALVHALDPRQAWLSATGGAIAITGLALVVTRL